MARKPYFRTFDGWWYAQLRVGTKRKQIKLVKGKENEQEAYPPFCRLLAEHEGEAPQPQARTVAVLCDLFLDHSQQHHDPETYKLYKHFLQDFCDLHGRRMPHELKPFHVSRWLDGHVTWKGCRANAVAAVKRAFAWATTEGLLDKNPVQGVKKPPTGRRERIVSKEEREQILNCDPGRAIPRVRPCHAGEPVAVHLKLPRVTAADVNLDAGLWVLKDHKTARRPKGRGSSTSPLRWSNSAESWSPRIPKDHCSEAHVATDRSPATTSGAGSAGFERNCPNWLVWFRIPTGILLRRKPWRTALASPRSRS